VTAALSVPSSLMAPYFRRTANTSPRSATRDESVSGSGAGVRLDGAADAGCATGDVFVTPRYGFGEDALAAKTTAPALQNRVGLLRLRAASLSVASVSASTRSSVVESKPRACERARAARLTESDSFGFVGPSLGQRVPTTSISRAASVERRACRRVRAATAHYYAPWQRARE
jgi:hypothetical protein